MEASTVVPERSLVQRMEALARANDVRSRRARMKVEIKRGDADARAVVTEPPAHAETMKMFDLLLAMPKVGRVKAHKILGQAKVSPSKTIGGLSGRQRAEIAALMPRSRRSV